MTPDTFVFTTPTGLPLDTDRFVESRWHRALRATGIRPRKFYPTRHTFISVALGRGCKPKWVAKYCGTSLEMLDKHYGRWMDDDQGQLDLLAPQSANPGPGGPKTRTKSRTISRGRRNAAIPRAEGGRFELREDEAQAEPKSRATPQTSKGNETASGSRFNPKTTRKNPT